MNKPSSVLNFKQFIVDPLFLNVGRKLESHRYYDSCQQSDLTTNNDGIDIIAHQLELKFDNNLPFYISWATIEHWVQYSLCISNTSFCIETENYVKHDKYWESIIGKRLTDFKVYGFKEYLSQKTELNTNKIEEEVIYNEAHLIVLEFENESVLGVGNFYLENDFNPKYAIGDDIWIIHKKANLSSSIKGLALEILDKENCH